MRHKGIALFFIGLGLIAAYQLSDRMIISRDAYYKAEFSDKVFIGLMDSLIADGVFRAENREVMVDERALAGRMLGARLERRVRESVPHLFLLDGEVRFDNQFVSVANSRVFSDERIRRGTFYDRNGVLLAGNRPIPGRAGGERSYPFGPEFFPVIGYRNSVFGKYGLEKELDDFLAGKTHTPLMGMTADPLKRVRLGDDVQLTLDSAVQKSAYDHMKDTKGGLVVLDVGTGEIVAAVSSPSWDPNEKRKAKWREAASEAGGERFRNKAFTVLYPPGSTFKTVVAAAWIERDGDGRNENPKSFCGGTKNRYGISDIHAHGETNLGRAFPASCNIFFSERGVELGEDLLEYARRFGFNREHDLLQGIEGHRLYSAASRSFVWKSGAKETGKKEFSRSDFKRNPKLVAQGAIGQNLVSATPLQMAMIASVIANRGVLMKPFLVKRIRTGDGTETLFARTSGEPERVVREETAARLMSLMEEVMVNGTGKDVKKIFLEGGRYVTFPAGGRGGAVAVAGKTGTAEVGDRNGNGSIDTGEKPHSWFIGFAPAEKPRYAVAVIAENQGFGSLKAAPIAMDVLATALNSR